MPAKFWKPDTWLNFIAFIEKHKRQNLTLAPWTNRKKCVDKKIVILETPAIRPDAFPNVRKELLIKAILWHPALYCCREIGTRIRLEQVLETKDGKGIWDDNKSYLKNWYTKKYLHPGDTVVGE